MRATVAALPALLISAATASAQEKSVTLRVVESAEHGAYLNEGGGKAFYLLTAPDGTPVSR